jgi:hypothetical protein
MIIGKALLNTKDTKVTKEELWSDTFLNSFVYFVTLVFKDSPESNHD